MFNIAMCNIAHVRQTLFEMPLEIKDEKSCQLMLILCNLIFC